MHNVVQLLTSLLLITTTSVFSKAIVDKPIEDEFKVRKPLYLLSLHNQSFMCSQLFFIFFVLLDFH